jgi:hypothetical protein
LESLSTADRREYVISSRDLDTNRKTAVRMENTMKERKCKRKTEGEHICEHEIERKGMRIIQHAQSAARVRDIYSVLYCTGVASQRKHEEKTLPVIGRDFK